MKKMLRQKVKYLENEKSFHDEIKNTFLHFWRAFIEASEKDSEGESLTLRYNRF